MASPSRKYPGAEDAQGFALQSQIQRRPHVLGDVPQYFLPPPFRPEPWRHLALHALGLPGEPHALGGGIETDAMTELAENMKHHVHVGDARGAALGKQVRFLCEDVEVESEPVPGEEGVALGDFLREILDEGGGFLPAHAVDWMRGVAAVPEDRLVGVGEEGGGEEIPRGRWECQSAAS